MLKDISAQTVQGNVHLTVNLTHVDMQMDHVLVLQVGWVIIVLQVMLHCILKDIFLEKVLKCVKAKKAKKHSYNFLNDILN